MKHHFSIPIHEERGELMKRSHFHKDNKSGGADEFLPAVKNFGVL
jgi:hypothetical protein